MLKCRVRNFFKNNGFTETYTDCFEKSNVAFVLEDKKLICCFKDGKGYKIQKETPIKNIHGLVRTNDGTAIY